MLENFFYLIEQFQYVLHSNRIYYSQVGQPPQLCSMVDLYVQATNDQEFAKKAVKYLDTEYQLWDSVNAIFVNGYKLYNYGDFIRGPRPNAYREDTELASSLSSELEKQDLYMQLMAAEESAFTFSSRWFIKDGSNNGTLIDTKCRSILSVELNTIFYTNAKIIASYYRIAGDNIKAHAYEQRAEDLYGAIQSVLWNEEDGVWYDYDLINNKQRKIFSTTNILPFTVLPPVENELKAVKVIKYLQDNDIDSFMGGVPTTLFNSSQEWDLPNSKPQTQWIVIASLAAMNVNSTNELAKKWALRWLEVAYSVYDSVGVVYDKVCWLC